MNWLLLVLVALLIIALGWSLSRSADLRRRLDHYIETVHRTSRGDAPLLDLPADESRLEELSNAVRELVLAQQAQISALDAERGKLAAVLDQMPDGVLIADAEGRVQFANPAAAKMFETRQAVGHTVAEVLRQHQLIEAWQRCQQSGVLQTQSVELPAHRQFLQLIAIPDRHASGSLLLVQDLTRVRRLETVRRDFISNVSHELRTPLASLKALTETLQQGALEDPPAARRFLGRIETEVDALTQMAQELLELTRIESGQVPLEFIAAAPQDLLASAVERMRAQAERAGVGLRTECPSGLPEVRTDPPRLEQVLVNLIHNAVKFTRPGGEVVLSAQLAGEFVCFSVRDTGVGISADDLPRIFERFYKADRARSGGGTGLGLSICRHLVEAHGGRIWAESEEGRGSTFYFTLPLS
ncbi:MAG: ATP-binding protein [Anaerolineales bacterium]|jgi:two-component system phosphate regulon sensor histidine kinase PhoR